MKLNPGNAEFRGSVITWKQHDLRTPGKFKEEYRGVGMACINSKTYIIWKALNPQGSSETKASAKSVQQKRNHLAQHIRTEHRSASATGDGVINTYTQQGKDGNGGLIYSIIYLFIRLL